MQVADTNHRSAIPENLLRSVDPSNWRILIFVVSDRVLLQEIIKLEDAWSMYDQRLTSWVLTSCLKELVDCSSAFQSALLPFAQLCLVQFVP